MIDQPDWIVVDEKPENKEKNSKRTLFIHSNHSFLSRGLLEIHEDNIIFKIPGNPKIERNKKDNNFYFEETWKNCMEIETPKNFLDTPTENILTFFKTVCKKPITPVIDTENQENFEKNYSFENIVSLLFLLAEKMKSLGIIKSNNAIDMDFQFPYFGSPGKIKNFYVDDRCNKSEIGIQSVIEEFLNSLHLKEKYSWGEYKDNLLFGPCIWESGNITIDTENTLNTLTAHQKIQFKKIIEDFSKTSKNIRDLL